MRRIFLLLIIYTFLFVFSQKADAAILFQDNFDSGTSSQWTQLQSGWQVVNGRYGATVGCCGSIHTVAGNITTPNYTIDLDILPILGVDKNITFRWSNNANRYEIHFNSSGAHWGGLSSPSSLFVLQNNTLYHIKVILNGQNIKFFVGNNMLFDVNDPGYQFSGHEQMGLRIGTGGATTQVWFDNIVVSSIDPLLDVPVLKQTDPVWGSQVYDSANIWSPATPGISRWGCALTSAAMVFKYHKINKLPDNSNLNPGTLNSWLKIQPDGFVRNGLLNWLALSRLSKLAEPNNPDFPFNALEYKRKGYDTSQLKNDIENKIPGILEEPGHFIVAKGVDGSTFKINDPFYDRTSLNDYSNTFLSLGRFVPSSTDLSYIMAVVDDGVDVSLKNSLNVTVEESFVQQPLDQDGGSGKSGNPLKILYFPKPGTGNYSLNLSSASNKIYKLDLFLYDKNGNVKIVSGDGVVRPGDSDNYLINFDKDNLNNNNSRQIVTFDSFIADIKSLYAIYDLNVSSYLTLIPQAKTAKGLSKKNITKKTAIAMLKAMDKQIGLWKGNGVSINAYNILHTDIQSLLAIL